jgi:hypothetical protein
VHDRSKQFSNERRKELRCHARKRANIIVPEEQKTFTGLIQEISQSGLRLSFSYKIRTDQPIVVKISFDTNCGKRVTEVLMGKIVALQSGPSGESIAHIALDQPVGSDSHPCTSSYLRELLQGTPNLVHPHRLPEIG